MSTEQFVLAWRRTFNSSSKSYCILDFFLMNIVFFCNFVSLIWSDSYNKRGTQTNNVFLQVSFLNQVFNEFYTNNTPDFQLIIFSWKFISKTSSLVKFLERFIFANGTCSFSRRINNFAKRAETRDIYQKTTTTTQI